MNSRDGSHVRRITSLPVGVDWDGAPRFSPDGRWLLFTRFTVRGRGGPHDSSRPDGSPPHHAVEPQCQRCRLVARRRSDRLRGLSRGVSARQRVDRRQRRAWPEEPYADAHYRRRPRRLLGPRLLARRQADRAPPRPVLPGRPVHRGPGDHAPQRLASAYVTDGLGLEHQPDWGRAGAGRGRRSGRSLSASHAPQRCLGLPRGVHAQMPCTPPPGGVEDTHTQPDRASCTGSGARPHGSDARTGDTMTRSYDLSQPWPWRSCSPPVKARRRHRRPPSRLLRRLPHRPGRHRLRRPHRPPPRRPRRHLVRRHGHSLRSATRL